MCDPVQMVGCSWRSTAWMPLSQRRDYRQDLLHQKEQFGGSTLECDIITGFLVGQAFVLEQTVFSFLNAWHAMPLSCSTLSSLESLRIYLAYLAGIFACTKDLQENTVHLGALDSLCLFSLLLPGLRTNACSGFHKLKGVVSREERSGGSGEEIKQQVLQPYTCLSGLETPSAVPSSSCTEDRAGDALRFVCCDVLLAALES